MTGCKTNLSLRISLLVCGLAAWAAIGARAEDAPGIQAGLAVRDITPPEPIWLSGYASRDRPSERVDHPLLAQALALKGSSGETAVLVSLDNCEVTGRFTAPVLKRITEACGI
ncbi:MAG: hypothetical protein JXA90_14230, partial [Planctomycetes bacterium]|nr:hypothetical protein [Planctomycetota bacterium]